MGVSVHLFSDFTSRLVYKHTHSLCLTCTFSHRLVSALFWVPGATAGIYAVRKAGIAVAQGISSSINVISSFIWGILIFHEGVKSVPRMLCAFLLLMLGLIGMSKYSKPAPKLSSSSDATVVELTPSSSSVSRESDQLSGHLESDQLLRPVKETKEKDKPEKDLVFCYGCTYQFALSRRQLGILGAVFNGFWGGMKLIPMHYAKQDGLGGAGYLISFAIGSLIVTIGAWIIYLLYNLRQTKGSLEEAIACLPEWYLTEMCIPGLLAGLLYTFGNLCIIVAVTYLGQGVGFSLGQLQLLVGGLWGIFCYKEIVGYNTILNWFGSAVLALCGIIWLSFEHRDL
jgi:glucose uptake protein GlcU